MSFSILLVPFLPLLAYVLVDAFVGYRAGIFAAFAAVGAMLAWDYSTTGELDSYALGEAGLIIIMGLIGLKMNSERFFKFQPAVVAFVFAAILGYFQFIDKPLLLEYLPRMEQLLAKTQDTSKPEVANFLASLHTPAVQQNARRLSEGLMWLFLGHGMIMAYAALRLRTGAWFFWRLAIYPGILALTIVVQLAG